MILDIARPSKPIDNALIKVFNGRLRAKYLNMHCFTSILDARDKREWWRRGYSEIGRMERWGAKSPYRWFFSIFVVNLKSETLVKLGRNLRSTSIE